MKESDDVRHGHLFGPSRGCQDQHVIGSCLSSIVAELDSLFGGLRSRACKNKCVREAILIQGISGDANGSLSLFVRQKLGLSVAALN